MCANPFKKPKINTAATAQIVEDPTVRSQEDFETRLRRRRAGAAADVLTAPMGLGA